MTASSTASSRRRPSYRNPPSSTFLHTLGSSDQQSPLPVPAAAAMAVASVQQLNGSRRSSLRNWCNWRSFRNVNLTLALNTARNWGPVKRVTSLPTRYLAIPLALWCIIGFYLIINDWLYDPTPNRPPPVRMKVAIPVRPLEERLDCKGARGKFLRDSEDDKLHFEGLEEKYPTPFSGSHVDLGIDLTWTTADGRYGPYGYGEYKPGYTRSKVDWNTVDWGRLQNECLERNSRRFPASKPVNHKFSEDVRFTWRNRTSIPAAPTWDEFHDTRRTALVLRSYEDYEYTPESLWFIRSLITEAALKTGGENAVVLLINVQDPERNIFNSKEDYDAALNALNLPEELKSIALLWDDGLLQSWYSAIPEHRTMWQANQPLQLFALHYPEFDHYWQMEMDQRYLGDAGRYLDAVSTFARYEPRKQAFERATFSYSERVSNTYANFTATVNAANHGRSRVWGPYHIPDIKPIGPDPPIQNAEDDVFWWGVGEDADALVTSFCADIRTAEWVFKDWIENFKSRTKTPRWWCPPAVLRSSRSLLISIHGAQHEQGLAIPSEAVIPSWAIWHGLKLSLPPQPAYVHRWQPSSEFLDETSRNPEEWRQPDKTPWFGFNNPHDSPDGVGHGNPASYADKGLTWWWASDYPRRIMDVWLAGETDALDMPDMLRVKDGKVYAPNLALHPVKT